MAQRFYICYIDENFKRKKYYHLPATATFSGLEPAYNQTARCLKMNIESGEWYPASCFLSSLPYICEKAADVGNLPNRKWFKPAKTTAEKCEFGWTYFEQTNYCYYFVKKPKTWEHANSFCQKKSARLVNETTDEELEWISGITLLLYEITDYYKTVLFIFLMSLFRDSTYVYL